MSRPGPSRTNRVERRANTRTAAKARARAVIQAARDIERAMQYGIDTFPAHRSYDQARARHTETRRGGAGRG